MTSSPIVLITGCSSGFGKAAVPLFLERGWQVIAGLRDASSRGKVIFEKEISKYPGNLTLLSLDVVSKEDIQNCVHVVQSRFNGKLDCLINNAGFGLYGALEDLDEAQMRRQMDVNFFGIFNLIQALLPALRNSQGKVINVSSVLGFMGMPLLSGYCASKFALEGMSESLFYELQSKGVQVSLVEPGGYSTQFSENAVWGARSFSSDSPYFRATEKYKNFRFGIRAQTAPDPHYVAKTWIKLAEMKKMPLRVRCGKDTFFVYWGKKILGEKIMSSIFKAAFKRAFFS